jgi:hypothetical protein
LTGPCAGTRSVKRATISLTVLYAFKSKISFQPHRHGRARGMLSTSSCIATAKQSLAVSRMPINGRQDAGVTLNSLKGCFRKAFYYIMYKKQGRGLRKPGPCVICYHFEYRHGQAELDRATHKITVSTVTQAGCPFDFAQGRL